MQHFNDYEHKQEVVSNKSSSQRFTAELKQAQTFERLFPTYLGSMTALIEEYFLGVRLQSFVLMQRMEPLEGFLADLAISQGSQVGSKVIYRRVLLHDEKTQEKFLYATCLLLGSNLPEMVVRSIHETPEVPLGRHLRDTPIEKTILSMTNRTCGAYIAEQFSCLETELCHVRRILFKIESKPAILIEEIFPCRCRQHCPLYVSSEHTLLK